MVSFDTTATAQEDVTISEGFPNTNFNGSNLLVANLNLLRQRALINFVLPLDPGGIDSIDRLRNVLTFRRFTAVFGGRSHLVSTVARPWTEGSATWNVFAGTGATWSQAGGDLEKDVTSLYFNGTYGSSFAFDITSMGLNWGDRGSIIVYDSGAGSTDIIRNFFDTESVGTVAWRPHIVVTATDNPPAAITDLIIEPDLTLSESSYTYRQRALLKWRASDEGDFKRYRIRFGKNRSLAANMTHLVFLNSRGTTSYLDTTIYSDGTTIYYAIYPEDKRNGSTSTALGATYCNVSNIVSWVKPQALIGRVSPSSSASTLDSVEVNVRQTNDTGIGTAMGSFKRAKIVWADGGTSYTETLTSAGGYAYARHRYTKATSGYTVRALVEDYNGFRSGLDSYATTITIANPGPVAKIVVSPSKAFTASTFSFGRTLSTGISTHAGTPAGQSIFAFGAYPCQTDGVGLSVAIATGATVTSTKATFLQLRDEGAWWRIANLYAFSTSTASSKIRRDINWLVRSGDVVAIQARSAQRMIALIAGNPDDFAITSSDSSTVAVGQRFGKWRVGASSFDPRFGVSYSLTNPVHFSAKDSFARASNRFINRFRWDVGFNGAFSTDYNSGATTSFYYAWTNAQNAFVAVRAVDDSHASSVDYAGVVVETESTFRVPDDLRDGIKSISDNRSRAALTSPVIGVDYGIMDFGSIEPVSIDVSGESYTLATTTNDWIDIARVSAVFQQRKRVILVPPWSTSTTVSGYVLDPPIIRDANNPMIKKWKARIQVVI